MMINILDFNISEEFCRILLAIDGVIYGFINVIYKIFLLLSNASLFSVEDMVDFVKRIYMVLGVIMLFVIAYSLLKALVNPDELTKGKQTPTKMIFNVVLALVLIEIMPVIFQFAYGLQSSMLNHNTIGKIIVGTEGNVSNIIQNGGNTISVDIFQAFFHVNADSGTLCKTKDEEDDATKSCNSVISESGTNYFSAIDLAKTGYGFKAFKEFAANVEKNEITYTFLISTIVGGIVVYILIVYCFDMALRAVKLSFYQIIAPIPILSRILPEGSSKDMFSKWVKATLSTFFEVFIRIAIIFFAVFMINLVVERMNTDVADVFGANADVMSGGIIFFAKAFIILGILMFVKQAPKLISDLTGIDSGNMSLGLGDKFKNMLGAGAMSAVAGGVTGFFGGGIAAHKYGGSFMAGALSGATGGFQKKGNQWKTQANNQYQNLTGDYKGKVGYRGQKTLTTRANEKAKSWDKTSKNIAASARSNRLNEFEEAKRKYEVFLSRNTGAIDQSIELYESSAEFKNAYENIRRSEANIEQIKQQQRAWEYTHRNANANDRAEAYRKIAFDTTRRNTISHLKSTYTNYKTDFNPDSKIAAYLRDIDTKIEFDLARNSGRIDQVTSNLKDEVDTLKKKTETDAQIAKALNEKQNKDAWVSNMREVFKQTGLDKDLKGDDKK